jgi:hypothetical protein
VDYFVRCDADTDPDGAGAGNLTLAAPLAAISSKQSGSAYTAGATTITGGTFAYAIIAASTSTITFLYNTAATTMAFVTNAMMTNGGRTVEVNFSYQAFS